MRSKSSEKRGRQKVVRLPTYRIENEYNPEAMPQYFQVMYAVLINYLLRTLIGRSACLSFCTKYNGCPQSMCRPVDVNYSVYDFN